MQRPHVLPADCAPLMKLKEQLITLFVEFREGKGTGRVTGDVSNERTLTATRAHSRGGSRCGRSS